MKKFSLKDLENQISDLLKFNYLKPKEHSDRRIYPKYVHFKYGHFWLMAVEEGQELDFILSSIFSSWEGVK